jgi:hypothetical protein
MLQQKSGGRGAGPAPIQEFRSMANATLRYQEFRSMANATLRYQEFRRMKFLPYFPYSPTPPTPYSLLPTPCLHNDRIFFYLEVS